MPRTRSRLTLVVSVALSGAVTGFSGRTLELVGVDPRSVVPAVVLSLLGHALAIVASTVLLTIFKFLLVHSHVPRRSLLSGAARPRSSSAGWQAQIVTRRASAPR